MPDDLQSLINRRQNEIMERLGELHRKQEDLFANKLRLMQRKSLIDQRLEELRSKGYLK